MSMPELPELKLQKIPLSDKETEKFLNENGFNNIESVSRSKSIWFNNVGITISLNPFHSKIHNIRDLFSIIYSTGFENGIRKGSFMTEEHIMNNFKKLVCEDLITDQSYSRKTTRNQEETSY